MILFAVSAWAQSVPNGDFEDAVLGWLDTSESCYDPLDGLLPMCDPETGFSLGTAVARGTGAGQLDSAWEIASSWLYTEALSEPFVVTRTQLSWGQSGTAGSAWLLGHGGALSAGPPTVDAFANWQRDVTAACGETLQVQLLITSGGPTSFDDVTLTGTACPDFLDADLDGWCPRGTDTDGDGDCADDGELFGMDCDDTDAAIGLCLDLAFKPWIEAGEPHRFVAGGAAPGETLWLVSAEAPGTSCPAALGGACTDLAEPVTVFASVTTDAAGGSSQKVLMPSWSLYEPRLFQVVTPTARSSAHEGWVVPDNDHPRKPGDPGVLNGNMEGSYGWSPRTAYMKNYASYDDHTCPSVEYASEPSRGAQSLQLGTSDPFFLGFCDGNTRSWPVRVTRTGLRWSGAGDLGLEVHLLDEGIELPLDVAGPVAAEDGFQGYRADLSDACGERIYLELFREVWDPAYADRVQLAGPPCPEYLDEDGDGSCSDGVDLDGDGACISAGEPDEPPPVELPIERLISDFETGWPAAYSLSDAEVAPHHTRGGRSGTVYLGYGDDWMWFPEVVTHETFVLHATTTGVGDWIGAQLSYALMETFADTLAWGSTTLNAGPGVWEQAQVDTSAVCGESFGLVALDLYQSAWAYDTDGPEAFHLGDTVLFDDMGFAGDPCPMFVDSNGDGACLEGLDTDGDGLCVSVGEPTPGTVQDPTE